MGNQNTGFMEDVCYIRLLLIVLLVIYHAFAIHSGAWNPIGEQIALYGWLDKFAYSFMLECFVFISGYVYGMQVRNGKEIKLLPEVKRKAKRLLLPCLVFGIVYILLFESFTKVSWDITLSFGHLWFLPMLFWCFMFTIIAETRHFDEILVILVVLILKLCNMLPLPYRLWECFFYLPFFYIAFAFGKHDIMRRITGLINSSNARAYIKLGLLALYILVFVSTTLFLGIINKYPNDIVHVARNIVRNILMLTYSSLGILLCFIMADTLKRKLKISKRLKALSSYCFGVYVYQQMILMALYYHTPINSIPHYIVPWLGFFIALLASTALTHLTLKTKIGQRLIG